MSTGGTGTTCPVCLRADPVGAHCPGCGWVLSAGPWAGAPSRARAESFAAAFERACRGWDLAAAALAAGYPEAGDLGRFERLTALARGPRPERADLVAAVEASTVKRKALGTVAEVITPLLLSDAVVVDIAATGITVVRLGTDHLGRPAVRSAERDCWHSLGLPDDDDRARFALAGGEPVMLDLPAWPDGAVVLNRLAGWRALDEALDPSGVHLVGGDEPVIDGVLVLELAKDVPQRHGCGLVLIDVAADGRTNVVVHPLFPQGATAADSQDAVVRVAAPPQDEPVLLAVVAGSAGTPPWRRTPISTTTVELAPDQEHAVRFRLTGPCTVEVVEPDTEPAPAAWSGAIDQVPPRYRRHDSAADLVVAVELGGSAFTRRQELALALIDSIERGHPAPASVRVAVLAYSDHKGRMPQQVLAVREFGAAAAARDFLDGLRATPVLDPRAAPVEDALWAAASLPWRSVARTLVVLGSRPPHPVEHCPNGHRWDDLVRRLERDDVHRVAVWDQPGRRDPESAERTTAAWSALTRPHTPLRSDWVAADRLAADARVLGRTGPTATLPFPLTRLPQEEPR
ncbi:hypothetical protein [Actinokineospora terrae]|uniref:Uncharacterized protein n=1 Tax=Actinokineospora terrae TaxID=155974 RepID=A0A1H9XEI1_9PSEU|nr:hypothetical protein [Actinokineospora terrae]SES44545.1 hypothetical protein SAMN04487818_114180 [Actinokineospora terrae]